MWVNIFNTCGSMVTEREIEVVFKALANSRRVAILKHLMRIKKQSVSEIAKKMKLSVHATSKHLTQLYRANLLEREQVSLIVFYSVNQTNPVVKLLHSLLSN